MKESNCNVYSSEFILYLIMMYVVLCTIYVAIFYGNRCNIFLYENLVLIVRVIGTPAERDWPADVKLSRNNFNARRPVPIPHVVPEITRDAADLLEVSVTCIVGV